jgi:hypothetical protein
MTLTSSGWYPFSGFVIPAAVFRSISLQCSLISSVLLMVSGMTITVLDTKIDKKTYFSMYPKKLHS